MSMLPRPAFLVLFLFFVLPLAAQQAIVVDVTGRDAEAGAPAFLNGYRTALEGQTITYHSSHPDAEDALICRARRDAGSISWQTDTIPSAMRGETCRFVWLAGIERIGWGNPQGKRTFRFSVNGTPFFTFQNRKDSTAPAWTVRRDDGSELKFESQFTDRFGDLFGMMVLTLPRGTFRPGAPLTLRVEGEDAGAPEWYMVFKYAFNFTPRVRTEPAILKSAGTGGAVPLRLSLDNLSAGRRITVSDGGRVLVDTTLEIGGNIFVVPVAGDGKERSLLFNVNGNKVSADRFTPRPPAPLEIYLVPHSHNDIGYTDLQTEVEKKQWRNIDAALDLIGATKDYPFGSRFRWNMEVLWPLESYMARATARRRAEVIAAVKDGSLGLNALLVNPLTGLANAPEMDRYTEYARRLGAEYGVDIPTAAVSDIPGFTWGIVSSLARSGVRYFASAPNPGDRTGYVLEKQGDRPFYWKSQSGADSVLFWEAGSSYALFHEGTLSNLGPEKLMKLLRRIGASGYPYGIYFLPYTLGDNGGPDTGLPGFVRKWNDAYETPKLVIATHRAMFEEFERRYGARLPVKRGDFTPYWEDGAASTASETALNRRVADRLLSGEALWSMISPERYPAKEYSGAWRDVSLWDEHTWGADISVSDPDSAKTTGQWEIKRGYVVESDSLSRELMDRALLNGKNSTTAGPGRGAGAGDTVAVYNTSSWSRTDVVCLGAEESRAGDAVTDDGGRELPSQRLTTGELAVLVEGIAPLSSKTLTVRPGGAPRAGSAKAAPTRLENDRLSVSIDTATGAVTGIASAGRAYAVAAPGAGRYLYVPGTNPDSAVSLSNVRVEVGERGPLVASVVVSADAPGCRSYRSEISVISGIDRVDIVTTLDKSAVREKEGVHIAFPFGMEGATFRYDVAGSIVEPGMDQLEGSCMNYYSVQSWADVSNDSSGITWTTADAPLVEVGGINAESPWMKSPRNSSEFYSYVMNNYWHTNYKADQGGTVGFRYGLHPHGPFDPREAVKRGREARAPLIIERGKGTVESLFTIEPEGVVAESVVPVDAGRATLVLLYNPSPDPATFTMKWRYPVALAPSGPSGRRAGAERNEYTIPGYGSQYLRADRAGGK